MAVIGRFLDTAAMNVEIEPSAHTEESPQENHWRVVAQRCDHTYVLRVDRIQEIQPTGRSFERPGDFDLIQFWGEWCRNYEENRLPFPVLVRVSPAIASNLDYFFKEGARESGKTDEDGWAEVELNFDYFEQARARLLGFGGAIEVLEPIALRFSVKDYAEQILRVYDCEC